MRNRKLWSLLLCAAMLLSVVAPAAAEDAPENGIVRIYFWGEPTETDLAAIAYTEETYQIKVDWEYVAWDSLDVRALTDINSGESPDLMVLHNQNFPRVAIQKLVKPVEELNQELYNHPLLASASAGARNIYVFGGKCYAAGGAAAPRYVFFNKTMFEDYGLDTPLELFEEGKWNWDTFRQCAMDVMDYDEEGNVTVWGFESWVYDMWVLANGGKFVEYTEDGGIELRLNDEKTIRALQFMQDGYYKDKFFKPDGGSTHTTDFVAGRCAMIADGLYRVNDFVAGGMKDEWDFVPVPAGPDNEAGFIPGNSDGWAICSSAKNPDGALMYLIGREEYSELHKDEVTGVLALLTDEQRARNEMYTTGEKAGLLVTNGFEGIGNIRNQQWSWWDAIFNGTPIVTANETNAPVFQAEIDVTLSDLVPKTKVEFAGLPVIDFEGETASYVLGTVPDGSGWGNSAFEIVEDGIEGKSLKITRDEGSEWQMAARTDCDLWTFPSYGHTYRITFDYRMLSDMGEGGYFYVCLRPAAEIANGAVNFGWATSSTLKAGDEGTFECVIGVDQQTDPLCIVLGGFLNGDILIDNLAIADN